MSIVLNELDWALNMIEEHSLGKKPYETLCRVAKYYISKGYTKKDARSALENFLLQCDTMISIPKWSDALDSAMAHALKYKAIDLDGIKKKKKEMDTIDSIQSRQARRLAFTLLCLAKYWDAVNPSSDHWVNTKCSEIMKMANIKTSIKRQSLIYHELNKLGLIQFSKKVDNTNVRVLFIDNDSDVVCTITEFVNLGNQYQMYHGEPFFVCSNCGITTKRDNPKSTRKQIYCKECATKIKIQQIVNSVTRKRKSDAEITLV